MRDAIRWFKCKLKPPKNGFYVNLFIGWLPGNARAAYYITITITQFEVFSQKNNMEINNKFVNSRET